MYISGDANIYITAAYLMQSCVTLREMQIKYAKERKIEIRIFFLIIADLLSHIKFLLRES